MCVGVCVCSKRMLNVMPVYNPNAYIYSICIYSISLCVCVCVCVCMHFIHMMTPEILLPQTLSKSKGYMKNS